jgi:glycosyltransferase involved in cell wall biosynthesis
MVPLVSIVLTAYNRAEHLRGTIETLLSQTFGDFELLVCDDVSVDHTEAVAREFAERDRRVQYHRNDRNLGMPGNLNEGICRSRGEYVANLHDGDLYDGDLLEKWVGALQKYPRAAFVFNQYRVLDGSGGVRTIHQEDLPPVFSGARLLEEIYFRRWRFDSPVWGTVMARRTAYIGAGLFDSRFGCIADVDMWMKLAENNDVAYVSEPLITLLARESLPSNWIIPGDLARQIFWEARMRHFGHRPVRQFGEAIRHASFATACRAYNAACVLNRYRKATRARQINVNIDRDISAETLIDMYDKKKHN